MEIGDLVASKNSLTDPLRSGAELYFRAVVVSVDPFVMISEQADMRWSTWDIDRVTVVGHASPEILERCVDRYVRDMYDSYTRVDD